MFDSLKEVNIWCRVYFLLCQQACTVSQVEKFLLMQNLSNFSSVRSKMQLSDLFLPFQKIFYSKCLLQEYIMQKVSLGNKDHIVLS